MAIDQKLEAACDELYGSPRTPPIPWDTIPCVETSDMTRLCAQPLVSVCIVTYNHESYIAECLASVLEQKTDFEFEVIVGEDCSKDRTREICFDFQRRFPDKVRVLWANENVYRKGGNWARNIIHSRGKYIAQLDGDDYWTDPYKLQKQVEALRKEGAISCVANYQTRYLDGCMTTTAYPTTGVLAHYDLLHVYPQTSTYLTERDFFIHRAELFPLIRGWYDVVELHCLIETGKVLYLPDVVSVYRLTGKGIATSLSGQQKKILGIKQYLDLYLHGPKSFHHRFGSLTLTYIAYFFNRSTSGWSPDLTQQYQTLFKAVFWRIFLRQFYDLRSIRAFLRYLRFRLGFVK